MNTSTALASKWKVGDIARYVTRRCSRYLILEVCKERNNWGAQQYCCLSDSGVVSYHSDQDLLTLHEWLEWWDRFQDETIPKEFRACQEAARREFIPPPWWQEAVTNAMAPFKA